MLMKVNQPVVFKVEATPTMYVTMPPEVYAELMGYVQEFSDTEVSGCGLVEERVHTFDDGSQEREFYVSEIFLPNQNNFPASSDVPSQETARVVTDALREGKDTSKMRFHWHSHVDMEVFHSVTDNENYDELVTGEFLVSLVVNKSAKMLARVDYFKPFRVKLIDIPVYVKQPTEQGLALKIKANAMRVKAWDKANPKTYAPANYAGNKSWDREDWEHDDNWNKWDKKESLRGSLAEGLADPSELTSLYAALKAGEEAGHITLVPDEKGNVVGYVDNLTNRYFEMDVYETYAKGNEVINDYSSDK